MSPCSLLRTRPVDFAMPMSMVFSRVTGRIS